MYILVQLVIGDSRWPRQVIDGARNLLPDEEAFGIALVKQRVGAHRRIDGGMVAEQLDHQIGGAPNVGGGDVGHWWRSNDSALASQRSTPAILWLMAFTLACGPRDVPFYPAMNSQATSGIKII